MIALEASFSFFFPLQKNSLNIYIKNKILRQLKCVTIIVTEFEQIADKQIYLDHFTMLLQHIFPIHLQGKHILEACWSLV